MSNLSALLPRDVPRVVRRAQKAVSHGTMRITPTTAMMGGNKTRRWQSEELIERPRWRERETRWKRVEEGDAEGG